jgi:hypothetical protein
VTVALASVDTFNVTGSFEGARSEASVEGGVDASPGAPTRGAVRIVLIRTVLGCRLEIPWGTTVRGGGRHDMS